MKRSVFFLLLFLFAAVVSLAQDFAISEFDGENLTVEYPACFDGAYLFIESCSNLTDSAWEIIDYSQINLASEGAMMNFSVINRDQGEETSPELNSIWSGTKDAA